MLPRDVKDWLILCSANGMRSPVFHRFLEYELLERGIDANVVSRMAAKGERVGEGLSLIAEETILKFFNDQEFVESHRSLDASARDLSNASIILGMSNDHATRMRRLVESYDENNCCKAYSIWELLQREDTLAGWISSFREATRRGARENIVTSYGREMSSLVKSLLNLENLPLKTLDTVFGEEITKRFENFNLTFLGTDERRIELGSDSLFAYKALVGLVDQARYLMRQGEIETPLIEFNKALNLEIKQYFPEGTKFVGGCNEKDPLLAGEHRRFAGTTLYTHLRGMAQLARKKMINSPRKIAVAYSNLGYLVEEVGSKVLGLEAIKHLYQDLSN